MGGSRWPVASCDDDFAPYLAGRPDESVALFWRFIALARASGPAAYELQNGLVVLRGTRRIFASVRVRDRGIAGGLNLPRRVTDRRIRKTEALTASLVFNAYLVTSMSDLDDRFGQWLTEARAVGDGAHLSREALQQVTEQHSGRPGARNRWLPLQPVRREQSDKVRAPLDLFLDLGQQCLA